MRLGMHVAIWEEIQYFFPGMHDFFAIQFHGGQNSIGVAGGYRKANETTAMTTPTHRRREGEDVGTAADAPSLSALYRDLKLDIEYRPIESLRPHSGNPRIHPPKQIQKIEESICGFGLVMPVLVDENDEVIGGHGVIIASKQAGYDQVPVIPIKHLDEAKKRALRIGLNRIAELAGWDRKLLAVEFAFFLEIDTKLSLDFSPTITGFAMPEIDVLIEEGRGEAADEDVVPEISEPPVSRPGDLWLCGEHRLICGDARDEAVYKSLLGDESAAAGLHDPPYNVSVTKHVTKSGRHEEFVMASGELNEQQFTKLLADFLRLAAAHSKPGAAQLSFMDWRHGWEMLTAARSVGLRYINLCVWDKGSGGLGSLWRSQHELCFVFADPRAPVLNNVQLGRFGRTRTNVWSWPGAVSLRKELLLHPTPKPVGLLAEAIRDVTNRGDIVLDCFSGSGSTIIAAAKTGRRGYAIELDPHFVDVGVMRWQRWSGQTARHAETGLTLEELRAERSRSAPDTQAAIVPPPAVRHRTRAR
jgi:hypothetical protein